MNQHTKNSHKAHNYFLFVMASMRSWSVVNA